MSALSRVLEQRKGADASTSYVASLYQSGMDKILKKVGEEAVETLIAAKTADQGGPMKDVIYETADLWFHTLVMLSHLQAGPEAVTRELAKRFGLSGLEEKAARQNSPPPGTDQ